MESQREIKDPIQQQSHENVPQHQLHQQQQQTSPTQRVKEFQSSEEPVIQQQGSGSEAKEGEYRPISTGPISEEQQLHQQQIPQQKESPPVSEEFKKKIGLESKEEGEVQGPGIGLGQEKDKDIGVQSDTSQHPGESKESYRERMAKLKHNIGDAIGTAWGDTKHAFHETGERIHETGSHIKGRAVGMFHHGEKKDETSPEVVEEERQILGTQQEGQPGSDLEEAKRTSEKQHEQLPQQLEVLGSKVGTQEGVQQQQVEPQSSPKVLHQGEKQQELQEQIEHEQRERDMERATTVTE
ncbi:hypothetical protein SAMD00019534_079320 [Acytostelium subglobosum LB1]|uniref:hypothetical protein n=1 Tax=Acytostelium subglobosum LB1 TaxID=1410327 RepID=UPI000644CB27|nr:hypothetical protein SAMD00019534_079320 [Acytostelium subglobosum LB1]GAM24757.1 hypothetical protein SAMD00019534_079320 [Acytostelium subglobosum LB1]|eukprot:XP_012752426.1 hypothetical protein SAMD00019534_079320 [Acytostelium subglobosum LB1]